MSGIRAYLEDEWYLPPVALAVTFVAIVVSGVILWRAGVIG